MQMQIQEEHDRVMLKKAIKKLSEKDVIEVAYEEAKKVDDEVAEARDMKKAIEAETEETLEPMERINGEAEEGDETTEEGTSEDKQERRRMGWIDDMLDKVRLCTSKLSETEDDKV